MQLIECVPNFSEGVNAEVIGLIAAEIERTDKVRLLNIDTGRDANRTVITFAGEPHAIVEAAFSAIKRAGELIDMTSHKGEHPRIGATDVCPLIPIAGITLEETNFYARELARRVGTELQIPVYLYEHSQPVKSRSNLAVIRNGEYEGLSAKMRLPGWKPDFGPSDLDAKRGATVIGARNFLVAYNVNLNTQDVNVAKLIASRIRESGSLMRNGDPLTGPVIRDADGRAISIPGTLKSVKAIGWYMEEYSFAQVSTNLTDLNVTTLYEAFEEIGKVAASLGTKVTGSELIGLIPLKAMLDTGVYVLTKQNQAADVSEPELIKAAVQWLGLSQLSKFKPEERIIEYVLKT